MLPAIIGLVAGAIWLLYNFFVSNHKVWESRGIPCVPAKLPFGNDRNFVLMRNYQGYMIDKMYKEFASQPYFGIYIMRTPVLVIKDPEIIKLVLVKEFSHFRNRHFLKIRMDDPLGNHLFNLDGERWRALRSKLVPTFTSGKLKAMFSLFTSCSEAFTEELLALTDKSVDVKDVTGRFTTETVNSCVFGIDGNTVSDARNKLRTLGKRMIISVNSRRAKFREAIAKTLPELMGLIGVRFTSMYTQTTLLKIIGDTMDYREKNGIKRNDFLDLMIQLKKKGTVGSDMKANEEVCPIEMDLGMITAQCFVFFIAGYETSSSVQCFCLYELALNPDIQERLVAEIENMIEEHGGLTYQAVQEMAYMDMVVHETMRKYPTLPFLTRGCTKPITLPTGHNLIKGDNIVIPIYSLHRDPDYFPDPEKFDPERFTLENRKSINPYVYMPFGEGPRICIGMSFGLLQTKMGLITILRKCQVHKTDETKVPLEFTGSVLFTTCKGPITLKFTPRT